MSTKTDQLIQDVAQSIIDAIEAAQASKSEIDFNLNWSKVLWADDIPSNHDTGAYYSGINLLILWRAKHKQDFSTSRWMTYKQAQKLGYQVRKGETGTQIVKYGTFTPKADPSIPVFPSPKQEGDDEEEKRSYLQVYTVFNVCQIDGIDMTQFEPPAEHIVEEIQSQACLRAKYIHDHCGAHINLGHNSAYYRPLDDSIYMPAIPQFSEPEDFYAVLFHELSHWTGAKHRLDRFENCRKKESYAFEELVAELGAAFLCADVGITSERSSKNHAGYIQSWLKSLKDDPKFLLSAASKASKAFVYINEQVKANAELTHQDIAA